MSSMAGSTPASAIGELGRLPAPASLWADAWRRFKRHRLAYWSLWMLGLLVLAVLLIYVFPQVVLWLPSLM